MGQPGALGASRGCSAPPGRAGAPHQTLSLGLLGKSEELLGQGGASAHGTGKAQGETDTPVWAVSGTSQPCTQKQSFKKWTLLTK